MITYRFSRRAEKQLRVLPLSVQQRIIRKIKFYIGTGNPLHFADTVEGTTGKIYRLRIGDDYRVVFEWISGADSLLSVLWVGLRSDKRYGNV